MNKVKLFFATNRNHKGNNQWAPRKYGKRFSKDGQENLRFGELELDYDTAEANKFLNEKDEKDASRIGNGENLAVYLAKQAEKARIVAYEDLTTHKDTKAAITFDKNSSTKFFHNLKDEMMQNKDMMIYIHGYNVDWHEAVGSAIALQMMLNSKKGKDDKEIVVVLFSWPSNGSQMPYAAYKSDRSDARDSGRAVGRAFLKLRDFLTVISEAAAKEESSETLCNGDIHLLCHSMGNYLLKNALTSKILGYSGNAPLPRIFKQIFLCSPDVADDAFEKEGFSRLHEMAANVTIYFNKEDLGMRISKYSKHFDDRLGQVGNARPSSVHIKVHQVDCSKIVHGFVEHSYYQWATVNQDIQQTIAGLPFDDESRMRTRTAHNREWVMV